MEVIKNNVDKIKDTAIQNKPIEKKNSNLSINFTSLTANSISEMNVNMVESTYKHFIDKILAKEDKYESILDSLLYNYSELAQRLNFN